MATGPAATALAPVSWTARLAIAKSEIPATGPVRAFGWASVAVDGDGSTVIDHQDDIIPPDELEMAAYDFAASSGEINAEHMGPTIGRVIESCVLSPSKREAMGLAPDDGTAWWIGVEITDPTAMARARAGEFSEFSIEGTAEREQAEVAS